MLRGQVPSCRVAFGAPLFAPAMFSAIKHRSRLKQRLYVSESVSVTCHVLLMVVTEALVVCAEQTSAHHDVMVISNQTCRKTAGEDQERGSIKSSRSRESCQASATGEGSTATTPDH